MKNSIIICTSNYENIQEIKDNLGEPIYNRFDGFIKFEKLDIESCKKIITQKYNDYFGYLNSEQKNIIEDKNIKTLLLDNASKFSNAREIDRIVRDSLMLVLMKNDLDEN